MTLTSDLADPDAISTWHRRGAFGFAGGSVVLALAAVATDEIGPVVLLTLVASVVATVLVYAVLVATHASARRWSLMWWSVASCVGIAALDRVAHPAAGLVTGLVVLSFLWIGLTQPPLRGPWFVAPAVVLFLQVQDLTVRMALVRVPIVVLVWVISCEVPARLLHELREKKAELELLATTDNLTGLLNRSRLDASLELVGTDGAVVLIDLDHFKDYNDTHGHLSGDLALSEFARVLRECVRPDDLVFRFGGEEFLLVLADTTPEEAAAVLERIRGVWLHNPSRLTFSGGVARAGRTGIRAADDLLYVAKAQGRDRIEIEPGVSRLAPRAP